ncbi:MAG TPA: carboxypeptidase regulatory-like domain-containing protein [Bryobacteraceae bacterium]|nr:carboxypeptidase regulatory-like domain-containing protein [Bryobacteraceae bacterium]
MRTLAALLIVAAAALAQSTDPKTCSADGIVTNSVTHAAIPRAQIEITLPDRVRTTQSDAAGKWRIDDLICGTVAVTVSRIGYIEKKPFTLDAPAHDAAVELTPQVVFTGRVIDDQGDPILGAHVRLLTSGIVNGRRMMLNSTSAGTNDLGEYRLAGLSPGRYILCASAATGIGRLYGERCLPGSPEDEASSAQVPAGFEGRFDFTLSPMPIYRVSGAVLGGPSGRELIVRAVLSAPMAWQGNGFSTVSRPDGTFALPNLPSGSYTLMADTEQSSARTALVVTNVDVDNVSLRLEPHVTVTAAVHALSTAGRHVDPKDYSAFIWADAIAAQSHNDSGESFTFANVRPGLYHFSFTPPTGFYLKSATLGGQDIIGPGLNVSAGMPTLEVTISDDGGTLEGDVTADEAAAGAWIYLERDGQPVRNGQADAKGHFRFDAIAPGDYKVYAWDDNSKVEYANPAWMQRYGKPVAVSVAPNQSAPVQLIRQIAPE